MNSAPRVLGINRTQDASVCLMQGGDVLFSIQKERITREEHHWGALGDLTGIYRPRLRELDGPLDLVVEGYSSDAEIENLKRYHTELGAAASFRQAPQIVQISHHLSHAYCAFYPSAFDAAAVLITDFQGSRVRDLRESWPARASAPPQWLEVSSFYSCRRDGTITCHAKQLWDGDRRRPAGLGQFYQWFSNAIFAGSGAEGKAMGLAPYGRRGRLGLEPLIVTGYDVIIPESWRARVFDSREFAFSEANFQTAADLAADGQHFFEEALLAIARKLRETTGLDALCLAGGCALNCAANGRVLREAGFKNVFVPPAPHDGGTALGCVLSGMVQLMGGDPGFRWTQDYLGPAHGRASLAREIELLDGAALHIDRPADLATRVAELIEQQNVVALFQDRSESGPRALGNRSLLADPRTVSMWRWINERIKTREQFRPFAPVVLEELVGEYFEMDRASPFMQFVANVRPAYREVLGAVTHVDGTARLQSVTAEQNALLYHVLKSFQARCGLGVVLNTSFNRRAEPIVETPGEALECFLQTDLHALAMPPFLLRKRQPVPVARS